MEIQYQMGKLPETFQHGSRAEEHRLLHALPCTPGLHFLREVVFGFVSSSSPTSQQLYPSRVLPSVQLGDLRSPPDAKVREPALVPRHQPSPMLICAPVVRGYLVEPTANGPHLRDTLTARPRVTGSM